MPGAADAAGSSFLVGWGVALNRVLAIPGSRRAPTAKHVRAGTAVHKGCGHCETGGWRRLLHLLPPTAPADGCSRHRIWPCNAECSPHSLVVIWVDANVLAGRVDVCAADEVLAAQGAFSGGQLQPGSAADMSGSAAPPRSAGATATTSGQPLGNCQAPCESHMQRLAALGRAAGASTLQCAWVRAGCGWVGRCPKQVQRPAIAHRWAGLHVEQRECGHAPTKEEEACCHPCVATFAPGRHHVQGRKCIGATVVQLLLEGGRQKGFPSEGTAAASSAAATRQSDVSSPSPHPMRGLEVITGRTGPAAGAAVS